MLRVYPKLTRLDSKRKKQKHASVEMRMTPSEKKSVLAVLKDHQKFYNEYNDDWYYQHNDRIGNDGQSFTTETIINDQIHNKIKYWETNYNSHIYEAYILRSNHVVTETGGRLAKAHSTKAADEYIDRFYVSYDNTTPPRYSPTINLFENI